MSYKEYYWRKIAQDVGRSTLVRHVICLTCGRAVGGEVTGFDAEMMARDMRSVARQHRKATGHMSFFFADGMRREDSANKNKEGVRKVPQVPKEKKSGRVGHCWRSKRGLRVDPVVPKVREEGAGEGPADPAGV